MNKWVIFDLDGTLANHKHRFKYARKFDWDKYFEFIQEDPINEIEVLILRLFRDHKIKICILTSRPERYRFDTVDWLVRHNIVYDELTMREDKDHRSSVDIKKEYILNSDKKIMCVFDDRPSIVNMVRELGITCMQTQHGEDLTFYNKEIL